MRAYLRTSCAVGQRLIFIQAQQMILLARKYAHIYARIYASGIQALLLKRNKLTRGTVLLREILP
jgi:hypothetical protein